MKKTLYIIALLALLIPGVSQASLYNYYGGNLPSISERSVTYAEIADDKYIGSAKQNNALESYLRQGVLGATTKIKLTDTNAVTPAATSTPTANMIPIANASGTLSYEWTSYMFGDGTDGDVVISTNTTSTRDMYYENLTINTSTILNPNGYRIFVRGILTNNGTIAIPQRNGGNGGNASAGAAGTAGVGGIGVATGTIFGALAGSNGGVGVTANNANVVGTVGVAGLAANPSVTGIGGAAGGNGGCLGGSCSGGGAAGAATLEATKFTFNYANSALTLNAETNVFATPYLLSGTSSINTLSSSAGSGGGESGYARSLSSSYNCRSGGGGGAGAPGGVIYIQAKTIVNNSVISSVGGNGGTAGDPFGDSVGNCGIGGSGGGAGGSGGLVVLVYKTLSGAGSVSVVPGTGGNYSGYFGSSGNPFPGTVGADGTAGKYIKIKVK